MSVWCSEDFTGWTIHPQPDTEVAPDINGRPGEPTRERLHLGVIPIGECRYFWVYSTISERPPVRVCFRGIAITEQPPLWARVWRVLRRVARMRR